MYGSLLQYSLQPKWSLADISVPERRPGLGLGPGSATGRYKPAATVRADMSEEFPDAAADAIRRSIEEEHGYLSWLGTRVDAIERGRVVLRVPYDEKLTNTTSPPTVHGGIAATLVDTAGGLAQKTAASEPFEASAATINLNVNYLRRADGDLTAEADVVRAGSSIGVSEATVRSEAPDGETKAVVTGQAAYRLFD